MMVISILDSCFCIGSLLVRAVKDNITNGTSSYGVMVFMNYVLGITLSASLTSDLCVLALSIERYFSVAKPDIYHNLTRNQKVMTRTIVGITVAIVGCTRLRYSTVSAVVQTGPNTYAYVTSPYSITPFFKGLATFSDMVLPFLLLVSMLVISGLLIYILIKRSKAKKNKVRTIQAGQPAQNSVTDEYNAIMLTLILDILFIANQSAYCIYTVGSLTTSNTPPLAYTCSYDELMHYLTVMYILFPATAFTKTITECVSHAVNFLLYVTFSSTYRTEFGMFAKRIAGMGS